LAPKLPCILQKVKVERITKTPHINQYPFKEEKMDKEKKLRLSKQTFQNLNTVLERDEQKKVKGGSNTVPEQTTQVPVFCKP
jgi:hypothetical protein